MSLAFSTAAAAVIHREVVAAPTPQCGRDVVETYELARCCDWITSRALTRVAVQFPDSLLRHASSVAYYLGTNTSAEIFILADSTYGSCCVDFVAAEHYSSDGIIHMGHSCLSPTNKLPVLYVFGRQDVDVADCCRQVVTIIPPHTPLIVIYNVIYHHFRGELERALSQHYSRLVVATLNIPQDDVTVDSQERTASDEHLTQDGGTVDARVSQCVAPTTSMRGPHIISPQDDVTDNSQEHTSSDEQSAELKVTDAKSDSEHFSHLGRSFVMCPGTKKQEYSVLYIGEEGMDLTNWTLHLSPNPVYAYHLSSCKLRKEDMNVNRFLKKRYYYIEKAKDAQIVGLLVGTLGVVDYMEILQRLKDLAELAGKKTYTFVMGKLNVAKLANFMEIDIFVLVACPETSLVDSVEFYRPVVTPYELELACHKARSWTGALITDYRHLLPSGEHHVPLEEAAAEGESAPDVSLITGRVRGMGLYEVKGGEGRELTAPHMGLTVRSQTGLTLAERSWQGLEQKLGKTEVVKAKPGRRGIAMEYDK